MHVASSREPLSLALAVLLLVGGRLGDIFGRKRMLLVGIGGFTAASVACAAAQSPEMLIGSRAIQGAFGAMMLPQVFGLIRDLFPPSEMNKVWGLFGPVMGLSAVHGPIVTVGLIALAFAAGFVLPRKPRADGHAPAIGPEPAFA